MKNLDVTQIKAGRALLDWSQKQLAEHAGMSLPAIANIESYKSSITARAQEKVMKAFELNGVEVIAGGVRRRNNIVEILEGDDCYLELLDKILITQLAQKNGDNIELLLSGADDARCTDLVIEKTSTLRKSGVKMRSLIAPDNNFLLAPPNEYRHVNENLYLDSDVKIIFGDHLAYYITWRKTKRIIIIKDRNITEESRRVFNFIWDISAQATHSCADKRYEV